jgi:hypothetical protein
VGILGENCVTTGDLASLVPGLWQKEPIGREYHDEEGG